MTRVYNFSAGPAALPEEVLREAAEGLVDYQGQGVGIGEMSHRSKAFKGILEEARQGLRELLSIPESHEILFLQGGATLQFSMVAMNLLKTRGDYISTGNWSEKAISEAKAVGEVNVLASSKEDQFSYIPKDVVVPEGGDYLHVTSNNTIFGTQFHELPNSGSVPLVVDASSDILSRPMDFSKIGLLYAGAQKNIGPSGVVVVVIDKALAAKETPRALPKWLKYQTHIDAESLSNTPPTFSIYMIQLVLKWVKAQGGISAMQKLSEQKADALYQVIDSGDFYTGTAAKEDRSLMNVTYTLPSEELTDEFLKEAEMRDLVALKGYRTVGGIRASIYNAVPLEGVLRLAELMEDFARRKG